MVMHIIINAHYAVITDWLCCPLLCSADANKLLVLQSCTTRFGPRSFDWVFWPNCL